MSFKRSLVLVSALIVFCALQTGSAQKKTSNSKKNDGKIDSGFNVLSWGPENEIPGLMKNPVFFVTFSDPVKELSALPKEYSEADFTKFFTVEPHVKGKYRWMGSRSLYFYASGNLDPGEVYTVKVNENLKNLDGIKLTGQTVFKTKAQDLKINEIYPGRTLEEYFYYESSSGVEPDKARDVFVRTNSYITKEKFYECITVLNGKEKLSYSVIPVEKDNKSVKDTNINYKETQKSNLFYLRINRELEKNQKIVISCSSGKTVTSKDYMTLKPFVFEKKSCYQSGSSVYLRFNHGAKKEDLKKYIKIVPEMKIEDSSIRSTYSSIIIDNLKLDYKTKYTVHISGELEDIYGQNLGKDEQYSFKTGNARSFIMIPDDSDGILDRRFTDEFAVSWQNVKDGYYFVEKIDNPFEKDLDFDEEFQKAKKQKLKSEIDNKVHSEKINLKPYLKNNYGFVRIGYKAKITDSDYSLYSYDDKRMVKVQVTDLGVTYRAGYDKAAVLVKSLSTDEPVKNASVVIYLNNSELSLEKNISDNFIAEGKTDENGFALFDIEESVKLKNALSKHETLYLMVQNKDDRVCVQVQNKSFWFSYNDCDGNNQHHMNYGISSGYNLNQKRVFIFTDRGIYRPGETVSFRGIAKLFTRNGYESIKGNYKIVFERFYNGKEKYGELEGEFSKNGGADGSFVIPEDIKPGTYYLSMYCGKDRIGSEQFTVSYFEKVKFSAGVKTEDKTYYAGDEIKTELTASYLAGGSLADSTYEAQWSRYMTSFSPRSKEANSYVFGFIDYNFATGHDTSLKGSLDGSGKADLSLKTLESDGAVYKYVLGANVTDVSNQRIFCGTEVTVHPGMFYIGAQKYLEGGFPKKGTKVEIPFAIFKPDGSFADIKDGSDEIKYSIVREYSEYKIDETSGYYKYSTKKEEIENASVKFSVKGSVSFVPGKAGYYRISFEAKDKYGNPVRTDKNFYVTGSDYKFDPAKEIELIADKPEYKPGEKAKVLLKSSLEKGDYLVTVERDKIYSAQIYHIDEPCSQIEIEVKKEYLPVVYVSVSSYRRDNAESDDKEFKKAKGLYGVCALNVNLDAVSFDVDVLDVKNSYKPGEEISFTLKALQDGKPLKDAELSVIITDRAVTDVIGYQIKNPKDYFYNTRFFYNYVSGRDSRDFILNCGAIINSFEEKMMLADENSMRFAVKSKVAAEGFNADAQAFLKEEALCETAFDESQNESVPERKNFNPTALFLPLILTDEKGEVRVKFKLPDSLTTYRITVVGVSENNFTFNESEMSVKNPVNVQSFEPRRLRTDDKAEAGVILTNNTEKDQTVKVSMTVRKPLKDYEEDVAKGLKTVCGNAHVEGVSYKEIVVKSGKTVPVYFNVCADSEGNVEFVYEIKSDVLKERLVSKMLIENSKVYETVALYGQAGNNPDKKENISEKEKLIVPPGCEGQIEITLDPTQLGLLGESVNYVFDYPYGCLEQQSSRIMPLVIFGKYLDTFGLENKVSNPDLFVKTWFGMISKEQHDDGSFPYWPGEKYDSPFVSLRFAHLYQLAKNHGYTDKEIGYNLERLMQYLTKELSDYDAESTFMAYACYVFSTLKNNSLDYKLAKLYNYCLKGDSYRSLTMLCYTALAYQNKGDAASLKKAAKICSIIKRYVIESGRSISLGNVSCANSYLYGMCDTNAEGLAGLLELYAKREPQSAFTGKILHTLLLSQKHGYWQSTAATARVFNAIDELIKARKLGTLDFVSGAVLTQNGTKVNLVNSAFKGLESKPVKKNFDFDGEELSKVERNKISDLEFTKDGKGTLYYTTVMRYAVSPENVKSRDEGLEVNLFIEDEETKEEVNVSEDGKIYLESGKDYTVTVNVVSVQSRQFVALRIPVASGVEIVDSSLITGGSRAGSDKTYRTGTYGGYEYYYDNEAQYFKNYMSAGTYTYTIKIRAVRRGEYKVPPVHAECMYEPEVFGRSNGSIFVIR
ncbi:MAG: hypothetical protein IK002_02375 [Treponema sp.]|uniref:alpha-2-macroglobulin family protein n=1 Tax=Treponema sp. TaxID=166 RepID=UPI00298EB318|nr:MG2 domain-containing protein [Treponema sp.]MBR5932810.1 hypothetical protein [Treponema sp.]